MTVIQSASPTCVYDSYWYFAAERQAVLLKRLAGDPPPWTDDSIIANHRFTNPYRVSDKVSQFLITDVIRQGEQSAEEVTFRVLLFKLFNKIETWRFLRDVFIDIRYESFDRAAYADVLTKLQAAGVALYSAAYMMPSPRLGESSKHADHLKLIELMMTDRFASKVKATTSLESLYKLLLSYPSFGPFLAYQLAIDLNYTDIVDFDENEFIVPGPGAIDGISKCFSNASITTLENIIKEVCIAQDREFEKRDLKFQTLFGRKLKLIDCQNLFCEISKYARLRHPEIAGVANRKKIKQKYIPDSDQREFYTITLPSKWLNRS